MNLSEKLLFLRRQRGLSQEELANVLNISRQAVHKWETTQSKPDIDNLMQLSKIFGVSVDTLLNDATDIGYANDVKKESQAKLGEVIADLDEDLNDSFATTYNARSLFPEYDKKEQRQRLANRIINAILLLPILAAFILSFVLHFWVGDGEVPLLFVIFFLVLIAFLAVLPFYGIKVLIMNKIENHRDKKLNCEIASYNQIRYSNEIAALKSKNYDYSVRLMPDSLAWLFYDKTRRVLGVFGNSKEVFVCPIQNFVDITVDGGVMIHFLDKDGNLFPYMPSYSFAEKNVLEGTVNEIKLRMNVEKSKLS